jgi:outer membrane protein OmpA-like peptidoglycan-associated protein
MALSIKRANAVRNYLVKKGGVAPSRLSVVGYGESMPIASNKTKEGRAQNRRVELKIIK